MKYVAFIFAALCVPPLAFLLRLNGRWMKYAIAVMFVSLVAFSSFKLNFYSNEWYRGTSRGMEVSLIYLVSAAIIWACAMRRKFEGWFPDGGSRIYALFFVLCLPSVAIAENGLFSWFEIWKMIMLHLTFVAVYLTLQTSRDVEAVLKGFAFLSIANFFVVAYQHLIGIYQPYGLFPHQNSMSLAMHIIGPIFFARYLAKGMRGIDGKIYLIALFCAAAALFRSYSRGAIALAPIAYGIATLAVFLAKRGRRSMILVRIAPVVIAGLIGLAALAPKIIERFLTAPEASADTRVQLALCAYEMIKEEPFCGVGINNWGIKINPPYPYAERANRETNRKDPDFRDGIVETVYLLVGAECGIPALVAMLAWFGWYYFRCIFLLRRARESEWMFIPAGLLGGFTALYLQSCLEWVLKQQMNLIIMMFVFALLAHLSYRVKEGRLK